MEASDRAEQGKKVFSRLEAARIWGVSEGLAIKLDNAGKIKTIRIGRRKLVPKDEIERILREGV